MATALDVHRDYLLARFREEQNSIVSLAKKCTSQEQLLVARHLDEIEYQIRRAFDDADKAEGDTLIPFPQHDHVEHLRYLLDATRINEQNCRDRDISGAEWWRYKIGPIEAAIAAMEKKP